MKKVREPEKKLYTIGFGLSKSFKYAVTNDGRTGSSVAYEALIEWALRRDIYVYRNSAYRIENAVAFSKWAEGRGDLEVQDMLDQYATPLA